MQIYHHWVRVIVGKGFQVLKYEKLGFKSQLMGAGLVFPYITVRAMLNDQHRMRVFNWDTLKGYCGHWLVKSVHECREWNPKSRCPRHIKCLRQEQAKDNNCIYSLCFEIHIELLVVLSIPRSTTFLSTNYNMSTMINTINQKGILPLKNVPFHMEKSTLTLNKCENHA